MKGLFHNEDCTQFFWSQEIPEGKAGEVIDRYVDVMAGAGVNVFLLNTGSQGRANYQSRAWESFWDGYDPAGPDDQPFLAALPKNDAQTYRKGIGNMLTVHQQGIDYPARVIRRCRHHRMSPWISIRMNDCHNHDNIDHPLHGSFWKQNPRFYRNADVPTRYFARCLDYAHPEVRDHFMAIIIETLERYDLDGLELDFMREPYLFRAGKEAEGALILNDWLREIRARVAAAGTKLGHPIRLGVRVPSRPEVAAGWGLDVRTWVKEGLIDLLVVTPRWAALEFDMPIREWREMLGTSPVTLAGGLEAGYRPMGWKFGRKYPDLSPELAMGAAVMVLSQGADAVYLFNYFQPMHWGLPVYQKTLKAMSSLNSLLKLPRSIGITPRDILAPGEKYQAPLPATGQEVVFPMKLGPIPDNHWRCDLLIGLDPSPDTSMPAPMVAVNGRPCEVCGDVITQDRLVTFSVPMPALAGTEVHKIKIISKNQNVLTIKRLEISFHN
jgi:hypothetical protein